MSPPYRMGRAILGAAFALSVVGCCKTPVVNPGTGATGAFVRAIPEEGGFHAQATGGLARTPDMSSPKGWPPIVLQDRCTSGQNEVQLLEQALALSPVTCTRIQKGPVPAIGAPASDQSSADIGFDKLCYDMGDAILVVEKTERVGVCSHIVGLAVFKKGP